MLTDRVMAGLLPRQAAPTLGTASVRLHKTRSETGQSAQEDERSRSGIQDVREQGDGVPDSEDRSGNAEQKAQSAEWVRGCWSTGMRLESLSPKSERGGNWEMGDQARPSKVGSHTWAPTVV